VIPIAPSPETGTNTIITGITIGIMDITAITRKQCRMLHLSES